MVDDSPATDGADAVPDRRAPIRTFKRRASRVTPGQQRALEAHRAAYGLDPSTPLDPVAVFGRVAPLVLEIGFGMGETTLAMAAADPARDVVAVDVHTPGVGALLAGIVAGGLTNVRVVEGDAVAYVRDCVAEDSVDEVRVFFPDPWPKARHHKRRLVSAAFVAVVARRLRPGGRLHVATDWLSYAEQVLAVVAAEPLLANPFGGPAPRPAERPVTRFERQGLTKGHTVTDVVAVRQP